MLLPSCCHDFGMGITKSPSCQKCPRVISLRRNEDWISVLWLTELFKTKFKTHPLPNRNPKQQFKHMSYMFQIQCASVDLAKEFLHFEVSTSLTLWYHQEESYSNQVKLTSMQLPEIFLRNGDKMPNLAHVTNVNIRWLNICTIYIVSERYSRIKTTHKLWAGSANSTSESPFAKIQAISFHCREYIWTTTSRRGWKFNLTIYNRFKLDEQSQILKIINISCHPRLNAALPSAGLKAFLY